MTLIKFQKFKKTFRRLVFLLSVISTSVVSIYFYRLINSYADMDNKINLPINETDFDLQENIINDFKNTNKLITLEIELSQTLKIDKSFGNSDLFSKYQYVKFFADCSYYVDISNLNKDDIIVDKLNNKLTLIVPKPKIYLININKNKTSFSESVNGLFRFGEINLSLDEISTLEENVYNSFKEAISKEDIYNKALSSSDLALRNFILTITENEMEILLYFK